MTKMFVANLDVVYFFYGFAYLALSVIVFTQIRAVEKSEHRLLGTLGLLGSFALIHALSEFSDMFKIIKGESFWLEGFGLLTLIVSFLFLLAFGYQLVNLGDTERLGFWLPAALAALFLGLPVFTGVSSPTVWNVSARYFLGFPGAILSSWGLLLYLRSESEKLKVDSIRQYIISGAVAFAVYAVIAGLMVPRAGFFPASLINSTAFLTIFGVPPQIIRALAATGIAWSMWHVVNIFNLEQTAKRRLAEEELREAYRHLEQRVEERTTELTKSNAELRLKSLLVDSAKDAIVVHDLAGKLIYANEAAYKDRGYAKEEFMALSLQEVTTPEYARKVRGRIKDLKTVGHAVFESAHVRKDGSIMDVEVHARVIGLEGKKVIISIIRDTTERKQAKDLSDALNKINAAINSTLDFETIMQAVVAEGGQAIGSEVVGVLVREDGDWVVRHVYGSKGQEVGAPPVLAAITREPVVSNDACNDKRFNSDDMKKRNIRSLLVLPLIVRGDVTAALYFVNQSAPIPFTDEQVDFGGKLAVSVSLAFENARLLREETNIADTLQKALITVPKTIPGLDFGYLYRSSEETAEVGGDFYDLFELEDDRAVVVIGDVSGKGLEAATLTSLVKNAIKAYAYQQDSPETIMAKTNDLIQKSSGPSIFVTLFLGIIDTGSGVISYCNAGHPPPLLRRKTGEIAPLEVGSPIIGVFSGIKYLQGTRTIEPGDALVLYTDGLTEARCDGELYGEARLAACLKKLEPAAIRDLPQLIYNELIDNCRCVLSDDLALMAISLMD